MSLEGQSNQSDAFKEKLEAIFSSMLNNTGSIKGLLREADALLKEGETIDLSDFQLDVDGNEYLVNDLLQNSDELPQSELIKASLETWSKENKVTGFQLAHIEEPITQEIIAPPPPTPSSIVQTSIDPAKQKYLQKDNAFLRQLLEEELTGQSLGTNKSKYAWTFKSGQATLHNGKDDNDEMNIFFLGTSTAPLFGIHSVDVTESGHVICQAALQKAQLGRPTLLVKGIATVDMDEQFPMEALDKPSIGGSGSGYTTVKGTGADTRLSVTMEQFFIPTLFKMLLNKPLSMRDSLTLNLAGHSRGGITTFIMADCADQFINFLVNKKEGVDYKISELAQIYQIEEEQLKSIIADLKENHHKIKTKICALDPVEGARSMAQWDHFITWREGKYIPQIAVSIKGFKTPLSCSYTEMPPRVSNALVFLASDERRSGFRPTIPTFAPSTHFSCKQISGKHGTLTGNFGNDACQGQFMFKSLEGDSVLKEAILGIFDETLININEFISHDGELPAFPRNTIRRIFNQPEYAKTKTLFLDILKENIDIKDLDEDSLVEECEKLMSYNERSNIILYDSLYHDAKAAIVHQKTKMLDLEKDWRHDTNVAAILDRDAWQSERRVYIRGLKVDGLVKWHEFKLDEVAPTRLPEILYYQQRVDFTTPSSTASSSSSSSSASLAYDVSLENLFTQFYHLKNKIELIANSPKLTREQKEAALFSHEFEALLNTLKKTSQDDAHHPLVNKILSELMIDIDSRYHICNEQKIKAFVEANKLTFDYEALSSINVREQMQALMTYFADTGINTISLSEVPVICEHIANLEKKIGSDNLDAHAFLSELKAKVLIQEELDHYINALEVYIERKNTITGQTVDDAKSIHGLLVELRAKLGEKSADYVKKDLQFLIDVYIQGKQHQSYLGKILKADPGSVSSLKSAEKLIHEIKLKRDIKNHELSNLAEDLSLFIKNITDYIASFKLRSPGEDTKALKVDLEELKSNLKDNSTEEDLTDIRVKMFEVIDKYIQSRPLTLTGGYSPSVKMLLNTKEGLDKRRTEQAQTRLQSVGSKELKNAM